MFKASLKDNRFPVTFNLARIQERIRKEVGDLIIESIREVLGNEFELGYDISAEYATIKARDPRLKRITGKSANQPLILKADIYDNIIVDLNYSGNGFMVEIREGSGVSPEGFDYADYFNEDFQGEGLHFMEKGLDRVEDKIPALVERILLEETGL